MTMAFESGNRIVCGSAWGVIVASVVLSSGCSTQARRPSAMPAARGVVLFIGDGMGDSEITIARNYHVGAAGRLHMDELAATADTTTFAIEEEPPHRPAYVADSAAGATVLATGVRTSNRRVATAVGSGAPLPTIVEAARAAGLRTGVVTTADLTDATPAAFLSHAAHRSCRAPGEMDACPGGVSIAEQTALSGVDVVLGGGRARFDRVIDAGPNRGRSVRALAAQSGYRVVDSLDDILLADGDRALLGLLAAEELAPRWQGDAARLHPGSGPQRCLEGGRLPGEPSLAAMTRVAIDRLAVDGARFFLMVEGASIDKRNHRADPCGQIGETVDLDEAVAVAREHGDLLVLVTTDHGHTSQAIWPPLGEFHSPGLYSRLLTREGAEMVVNYGTSIPGQMQSHSGTQVRVAGAGPGAEGLYGLIGQPDIHRRMMAALGLMPR